MGDFFNLDSLEGLVDVLREDSLIFTIWRVWGMFCAGSFFSYLYNLEGLGDVLEVVSLIFTIWRVWG